VLLSFLRDRGIDLEIERDEGGGSERVVEFRKVAVSSRDKIEYYLDGGTDQE
jgi:putative ATP-dependent DNA ligase